MKHASLRTSVKLHNCKRHACGTHTQARSQPKTQHKQVVSMLLLAMLLLAGALCSHLTHVACASQLKQSMRPAGMKC
jgi:hypothetical protein